MADHVLRQQDILAERRRQPDQTVFLPDERLRERQEVFHIE
jgi:hypothetical protein